MSKKKKILLALAAALLILALPLTLVLVCFSLPPQFGQSYYGQMTVLYEKLKSASGKKLLIIGNSAVAFGVRGDLLEKEFEDYEVIAFGLYGSFGTKAMLELASESISEGDIVVIVPELYEQTCNLTFSAKEFWRAADGDYSMISRIDGGEISEMIWNFAGYAAEKFAVSSGSKILETTGAYSRAAFEDENGGYPGYMTYERPYNVMAGGYDAVNLPTLSTKVYGEGFLDYLNAYAKTAKEKGAAVLYGFTPMNALALGENAQEDAERLYDGLRETLDFEILGHPAKYLMDKDWFYDNNVHTNSAGSILYTDTLAEDLKLYLGVYSPNGIELPEKPQAPEKEAGASERGDVECFVYEIRSDASGEYAFITGLTGEGKKRTELTLPSEYEGLPVKGFAADVFAGNKIISRIVLPASVTTIYDDSFAGASRLTELVFRHDSVLGLSIGADFLRGADRCLIYLRKGVSTVDCAGGWAKYESRMRYY